jgi:hydroxymethylbilane synthase
LIVGTRGSRLALQQTSLVEDALRAAVPDIAIEQQVIQTQGDRDQTASLEAIGGQGVFVKEIELALLAGSIDLAVHSLKDMPAELPAGLAIACVLPRADVRDALVTFEGRRIEDMSSGDRIGTDSRRRALQLREIRPDVMAESIRGNVDTRVHKALSGEIEGVQLAVAGLERLGLLEHVTQYLSVDDMLPAVGQGILAIEARIGDTEVMGLLRSIDDAHARIAATAERAFLRRLGAGCRLPVAAYGEIDAGRLRLRGLIADEYERVFRDEIEGAADDAGVMGYELADRLLERSLRRKEG